MRSLVNAHYAHRASTTHITDPHTAQAEWTRLIEDPNFPLGELENKYLSAHTAHTAGEATATMATWNTTTGRIDITIQTHNHRGIPAGSLPPTDITDHKGTRTFVLYEGGLRYRRILPTQTPTAAVATRGTTTTPKTTPRPRVDSDADTESDTSADGREDPLTPPTSPAAKRANNEPSPGSAANFNRLPHCPRDDAHGPPKRADTRFSPASAAALAAATRPPARHNHSRPNPALDPPAEDRGTLPAEWGDDPATASPLDPRTQYHPPHEQIPPAQRTPTAPR